MTTQTSETYAFEGTQSFNFPSLGLFTGEEREENVARLLRPPSGERAMRPSEPVLLGGHVLLCESSSLGEVVALSVANPCSMRRSAP